MDTNHSRKVILNGVEFDPESGLLHDQRGSEVPLRLQSQTVLKYLLERSGQVVSKDDLMDAVWPGIAVTDNSLSQCISEIRKALDDEAQVVLKTVPRRGYRLVFPVASSGTQSPTSPTLLSVEPSLPDHRRRVIAVITALLTIGATALFIVLGLPRPGGDEPALSIAVLPFQNLSEDRDQAYLADGIADDLTTELARVPGLFVVSRNATLGFADSALPPSDIAQDLGVSHLLLGSVQRVGDEVRINAQLVDGKSEGQVWASRFNGTFVELFDLQDQVVSGVVDALQVRLVPGKANLAVSGDTDNPEAFQALRRAIEARRRNTPESTVEALSYLRQALAIDPEFGAAAAEMAWLYWDADDARLSALGITGSESAKRLEQSLGIASRNPSPGYYQLSADLLTREHRSDEAVAYLEKAILLDPSDPWTFEGLAQVLAFNGRPGEAQVYLETANRLDPGWTDWRRYLAGLIAFGEGRYADAIAVIDQIDLASPDPWSKFYAMHINLAAHAHLGQTAELNSAKEKLRTVATFMAETEPDLLNVQRFFIYKEPADMDRLLDGLRRAGVAEAPEDILPPGRRLSQGEILQLLADQRLIGRQIRPSDVDHTLIFGADGHATKLVGDESVEGHFWIQGDTLCTAFPVYLTHCGFVSETPTGPGSTSAGHRYDESYAGYALSSAPN